MASDSLCSPSELNPWKSCPGLSRARITSMHHHVWLWKLWYNGVAGLSAFFCPFQVPSVFLRNLFRSHGKPMEQLLYYNPFTNEQTDRGKITPLSDSQVTISTSHTFKVSLQSQGLSRRTKVTQETFSSQLPYVLNSLILPDFLFTQQFLWKQLGPRKESSGLEHGLHILLTNRASDHTQCPQLSTDTGDYLVPMPGQREVRPAISSPLFHQFGLSDRQQWTWCSQVPLSPFPNPI